MVEVIPSRLAADVLTRALCSERSLGDAANGRLRVLADDPATVRALLSLVEEPGRVEWTGESGTRYLEYLGGLPCGLTLVIQTDADLVPLVELPEGGV